MGSVTIPAGPLSAFVEAVLTARGMSNADAALVAEALVWADLRDVGSHGVFRLPRYVTLLDRGDINAKAVPEIRLKLPAALVIEADQAFGAVAMMRGIELACEQARSAGITWACVSHTTHTGAIGYFANWAAERGFAAIVASAGSPNMAYHGARVPSLSTSPVAIAVPGGDGPLALDMSTAILGIGRLAQLKERGEPLPPDVALDSAGNPTTDPAKGNLPMPLGGPKGSGLALMLECLAGILAGTPLLAGMIGPQGKYRQAQHNGLIIVADVAQFRPLAGYKADIDALAAAIRGLPRRPGVEELLLPGERGRRAYRENVGTGARISVATWAELETLSRHVGVPLPAPAA